MTAAAGRAHARSAPRMAVSSAAGLGGTLEAALRRHCGGGLGAPGGSGAVTAVEASRMRLRPPNLSKRCFIGMLPLNAKPDIDICWERQFAARQEDW